MATDIERVINEIELLPDDWHTAGILPLAQLRALARHAGKRRVRRSMETGSGASTLLLSHLSDHHEVFSLDVGGSLRAVRESPLARQENLHIVEGPTHATLPSHAFGELDLALIDGPHAYPFPDLEYYHVYPHLVPGSLLVIDDLWIPSIYNLFRFLREDDMFRLLEVVDHTAYLERTTAPTFDPAGGGWWEQRYNTNRYPLPRLAWSRGVLAAADTRPLRKIRRARQLVGDRFRRK